VTETISSQAMLKCSQNHHQSCHCITLAMPPICHFFSFTFYIPSIPIFLWKLPYITKSWDVAM